MKGAHLKKYGYFSTCDQVQTSVCVRVGCVCVHGCVKLGGIQDNTTHVSNTKYVTMKPVP